MPVSQGAAGGIPNMVMKGWAYAAADGTMLRGAGVSLVTRSAVGAYSVALTNPTTTNIVARVLLWSGSQVRPRFGVTTAGAVTVRFYQENDNATPGDSPFYIEIYE